MTIRLFFAITIEDAQRAAMRHAIAQLQAASGRAVRWVDPEAAHLTLAFLGEVAEARVGELLEAASAALRPCQAPLLQLTAAGAFPDPRHPRILWLGIDGEIARLSEAQRRLSAALEPLGFPPEQRPFRPHLTLGRVRREASGAELAALAKALARLSVPDPLPWSAAAVQLFRSELLPGGPCYTPLGSIALT